MEMNECSEAFALAFVVGGDNRHEQLQRCEVEGGYHDTVVVHRGPNRFP